MPLGPDGVRQTVFYDQGVGSGGLLDKVLGGALGWGLSQNVRDAYLFLVRNYEPGDEIYLFGFSRGAFTVRSCAGLIRKCGLLREENHKLIRDAYALYKRRDATADAPHAIDFRRKYSHDPVPIKLIGVWDTVGTLGVPFNPLNAITKWMYEFHDDMLSRHVEHAYHAVAIDERRRFFNVSLWQKHGKAPPTQKLEQVWFPGCHADIGGGNKETLLSNVALNWMIEKAHRAGLQFNGKLVADLRDDHLGPIHESLAWYWLPFGKRSRNIAGGKFPNESVSQAARDRWRELSTYRPANLADYGDRFPPWP